MKKLLIALLGIIALSCYGQRNALFTHFSYSGNDSCYSAVNEAEVYMNPVIAGWSSDPSICRRGDDYFLVVSTFTYFPGITLYHSRNLTDWQMIGGILNRQSRLDMTGSTHNRGLYAPAISYNKHNGLFYVIVTDVNRGNFYVTTSDPFGEWSDPVWLDEIDGIDPSFFFDEDGKTYIVHKDPTNDMPKINDHFCIKICPFDTKTGKPVLPEYSLSISNDIPLAERSRDEGPHIFRANDYYYLICAEGGTNSKHSEVVYRAKEVLGKWERYDKNPILTQRDLDPRTYPNAVTCSGHLDVVETRSGVWWGVFLACRPIDGKFENLGRETFLMPVRWTKDKWPYITQPGEKIPLVAKRSKDTPLWDLPIGQQKQSGNFSWTDTFCGKTLNPRWMSLRADASHLYKMTGSGLSLSFPATSALELQVPAYVGCRLQHHVFSVEASMSITPGKWDRAGLSIYRDEIHHCIFVLDSRDNDISMRIYRSETIAGGMRKYTLAASEAISTKDNRKNSYDIDLRISSPDGRALGFAWRMKGSAEWHIIDTDIKAVEFSTATAKGFTGTTIGMYAEHAVY